MDTPQICHPAYEETALIDPEKAIRILTICPSAGDALTGVQTNVTHTISCTLATTELNDAGDFEAHPYCWGHATNMETISLNERSFSVRENLWLALKQLQQKTVPRRVWIDAICIAQKSFSERNARVSIMRNIFSKATMVIAWIGPEIDHVKDVFQYCNLLSPGDGTGLFESDRLPEMEAIGKLTPKEQATSVKTADEMTHYAGLIENVYKLDWFSRIWVLQEVAVAKKVLLKCGGHNIWLRDFLESSRKLLQVHFDSRFFALYDLGGHFGSQYSQYTAFAKIVQSHRKDSGTGERRIPSLASMCIVARRFSASLAADKVFALFGLAFNDVEHLCLYPQYDVPVERVYTDITFRLLHDLGR